MIDYPFAADTRLLRWIDSSSAGRTITLELPPNEGEGHPFKGFPVGPKNGQRFRMSFEPIGDDEQPVKSRDPGKAQESRRPEEAHIPPVGQRSLPPTTPAGAHIQDLLRSVAAKARYASLGERDRVVADAGKLANNEAFQRFASKKSNLPPSVELAASYIRARCAVSSRKELAFSDNAFRAFRELETEFALATGRIAEPRE